MAEFHANALTLVGNFSGPCIIFLTGEAITVRQGNGVEIAKWPYNCIRQFKAEDETGKFSFVSGRRGPYGVAEYNFGLDDVSKLQHALSQFTGAQFSQAPPTSQPPLPPLPPIPHSQRPASTSSFGRYSMGGRTDSVDSVFASPGHARVHAPPAPGPRLPPRDYLHSSESSTTISNSLLSSSGGYSFSRSRNSASVGDALESGSPASSSPPLSNRSCVPQPSVGRAGPYVSANEQYQNHRGVMDKPTKTEVGGGYGRARKSSPGTPRRTPLMESISSESRDEVPDLPPRESLTRPKTNSTGSMAPPTSSTDTKSLKKQQTEPSLSHKPALAPKPTVSPKPKRVVDKELPPSSTSPSPEHAASEKAIKHGSTSVTPEPQMATSGTSSPILDTTDLDHIPRSSPQVSRGLRTTLRGRQSPVGKLTKSTTTPSLHAETYDVPKALKSQLSADDGSALYNNVSLPGEAPKSEDLYQVPRPTVDSDYHMPRPKDDVLNEQRHYHHPKPTDEIYKVPRPMSGSYSSLLIGQMSNNFYSNPRPPVVTRSPQGVYYSSPPDDDGTGIPAITEEDGQPGSPEAAAQVGDASVLAEGGQLYGNVTLGEQGGTAEENFYNVPRPGVADDEQTKELAGSLTTADDGLYNVPRPLGVQQEAQNSPPKGGEDLYKVPRRLAGEGTDHRDKAEDGLYKVPRQSGSESPPPRNPYEMVDLDQPRLIRPARSLESLHRIRTLPPRAGNRYVDLNVDNPVASSTLTTGRTVSSSVSTSWIQTQPLPPRPTQNTAADDDNLYAEIPEDLAKNRNRLANGRWSPPARGERRFDNLYVDGPDVALDSAKPGHTNYDKLPPRRPSPEVVASEGVAKAKELAKQGYELCLPSGEDPRLSARTPPISMPPRNIPRRNFSSGDVTLRSHRSVSGSEGTSTASPSEAVLGTSIPSDSTKPTTDEYVIITRSDTRLTYSQTQSKGASNSVAGDEYEEMNSVKSLLLLSQSSHYSTPNPSLYRQERDEAATAHTTTTTHTTTTPNSTEMVGGASDHLYGNTEQTDGDFSDLDRATRLPAMGERRLVRAETLPARRKTISASSNDSDVFVSGAQLSSSMSGAVTTAPAADKKFVRIGVNEPARSSELRLRSCSVDDYLDNGKAEKPNKRHSYVNVPNDSTESNETSKQTADSAAEPSQLPALPKKPKPFPRTSTLRRTDSDEPPKL